MPQRFAALHQSLRHSAWMLVVPLAWVAIVVAAEVTSPEHIHLGPLLVAAPAVTASFGGPVATGLVAALSVTAQIVIALTRDDEPLFTANHQAQIFALILVGACLVGFSHVEQQRGRQLSQARHVAETAQQLALRPLPERIGPLRVASLYLAAAAEARIGGDLYAAARTPSGTRLIIGDVRGKGMSAVGDATLLIGAFRAAVRARTAMAETAAFLDDSVTWNLGSPSGTEQARETFITASLVDIPDDGGNCGLVVCGHPPPLLLREGRVVSVEPRRVSPPLGLGTMAPSRYLEDTFELRPGDLLVLYTDGITEARDSGGRFYPLAERMALWADCGPEAFLQQLVRDLSHYVGGSLGDDAAVIAVERVA